MRGAQRRSSLGLSSSSASPRCPRLASFCASWSPSPRPDRASRRAHRLYPDEIHPFSMQDYYVKGERWIRPAPAQHADHVHEPTAWWEAADEAGLRDAEGQDAM